VVVENQRALIHKVLWLNPNATDTEFDVRAKEFIHETTTPLRKSVKAGISGLRKNTYLDNNNNPYLAYRMGIAMAGSPGSTMDQEGPLGSNFITVDYTEGDAAIRQDAEKLMGAPSQEVTGKGSKEIDNINTQSTVAAVKRNRYGV
jgi:hypothetical protein